MNYLITLKPLKHNSNLGCYSILAEFNSETNKLLRKLLIPSANFVGKNCCMRSFSQGVHKVDNLVYVAGYNFILIVDYTSFKVIDSFSHQLMSDIHCLEVYANKLYVVSTTIDALLCFDLKTKELNWVWRIEDSNLNNKIGLNWRLSNLRKKSSTLNYYVSKLGLNKYFKINFVKFDFRGFGKTNSPYYSCHLNELRIIDDKTIMLGTKGWQDKNLKNSSLIKLNTETKRADFIASPGSFIATHDLLYEDNKILVTESINESVAILDLKSNKIDRIELPKRGYFIRGIAKTKKGYLVGFSPNRGLLETNQWQKKEKKHAVIEHYNSDFTNILEKIRLDNYYPDSTGCAIHNIVRCV